MATVGCDAICDW